MHTGVLQHFVVYKWHWISRHKMTNICIILLQKMANIYSIQPNFCWSQRFKMLFATNTTQICGLGARCKSTTRSIFFARLNKQNWSISSRIFEHGPLHNVPGTARDPEEELGGPGAVVGGRGHLEAPPVAATDAATAATRIPENRDV